MWVAGLRHTFAEFVRGGGCVTFDDSHAFTVICEDAGGSQTGNAAADHNGMLIKRFGIHDCILSYFIQINYEANVILSGAENLYFFLREPSLALRVTY